MTITLAAVYAPIGIQGGLTGALFREFAFTLAGAVIVSGVVALTLSPMMGSKLLRSGDSERGFAGWVNRRFDFFRATYARQLAATLNYRPVVLTLWVLVTLLIVPFYLFSQKELAPTGGPERRLRRHPGGAERHARPDEALRLAGARRLPVVPREREHLPDHVPERRLRRHGHEALERAEAVDPGAPDAGGRAALEDPRRPRHLAHPAAAPRRRATSRWTSSSPPPPSRSGSPASRASSSGRRSRAASSCSPTRT